MKKRYCFQKLNSILKENKMKPEEKEITASNYF